jgi:hypothetical protein
MTEYAELLNIMTGLLVAVGKLETLVRDARTHRSSDDEFIIENIRDMTNILRRVEAELKRKPK